jgi:GrpB-like predicted nucleotidyltransferase (UPF0157 family)
MTTGLATGDGMDPAPRLIAQERLNATVQLDPYDPAWPQMFAQLAGRLQAAVAPMAVAVHHAGSTSVPGLSAKPVIDIVLAVPDPTDEPAYVPALESIGYRLHLREPDWFDHRLMKHVDPAVNLHVFAAGCPEIDRMLAFRDWLRAHEDDRRLYEAEKQRLAAQTWAYMQDYANAKGQVVQAIIERATADQAR